MKYFLPNRIRVELELKDKAMYYEDSYAVMRIELEGEDHEPMTIVPDIKVNVDNVPKGEGEREMGLVQCLEQAPRIVTAFIVNAALQEEAKTVTIP